MFAVVGVGEGATISKWSVDTTLSYLNMESLMFTLNILFSFSYMVVPSVEKLFCYLQWFQSNIQKTQSNIKYK